MYCLRSHFSIFTIMFAITVSWMECRILQKWSLHQNDLCSEFMRALLKPIADTIRRLQWLWRSFFSMKKIKKY